MILKVSGDNKFGDLILISVSLNWPDDNKAF